MRKILIGNTFSLTLIRGDVNVSVHECGLDELKAQLEKSEVASFWGHENTRRIAERMLGVGLEPREPRPAVRLSPEGLPMLYGETFEECYVVSPDYVPGFRPTPCEEVSADRITGWHILKLKWQINNPKGE